LKLNRSSARGDARTRALNSRVRRELAAAKLERSADTFRKRYEPTMLREIAAQLLTLVDAVCRHLEVSVQTYQRWRAQFKAMRPEDVVRLKALEKENARQRV
jgi:hypothetical protein